MSSAEAEVIIVKINLNMHPEDQINMHLSQQSKETEQKIAQVIQERKILDKAKNALKEQNDRKNEAVKNVFTKLVEAGESGVPKQEVVNAMYECGAAKSASGVTLSLKSMVANELVGHKLDVSKDKYFIVPDQISK